VEISNQTKLLQPIMHFLPERNDYQPVARLGPTFIADKIATAPVCYQATATIAAPADRCGTAPGAPSPSASRLWTSEPAISTCPATRRPAKPPPQPQTDYSLDADPDVLHHLATVTDRARRASRPAS